MLSSFAVYLLYPKVAICYHLKYRRSFNSEREKLTEQAIEIHQKIRDAAGTRTIVGQLNQSGERMGRYKASSLMKETGHVSTQLKKHRYKIAEYESKIAPN